MSNTPVHPCIDKRTIPLFYASEMVEAMHTAVDRIGDALGSETIQQMDLQNALTVLENAIELYYDFLRRNQSCQK